MDNFRIAVKSFIINNDKLLLVKRATDDVMKPSVWEIPGGRLSLGEDPKEGLKREVKEETGIDIEVLHPINVRHFVRSDKQTITMLIFLCRAEDREVKLSEEHSDFVWASIDDCKEKLTDFFHPEVDIYNKLELYKHL